MRIFFEIQEIKDMTNFKTVHEFDRKKQQLPERSDIKGKYVDMLKFDALIVWI